MKKFELSISPDYVADWGVIEAVRELFQNALDQQTINKTNAMFFTYDKESKILRVGNKDSILNVQSLLLGSSTKRDDNDTIGKFGEGYKIATLVLLRLGKPIVFYNYGSREVWKPRLINSRRYNGAKILTFFVDKSYFWESIPDNNLTIEVEGISEEEYNDIIESNLHCQDVNEADIIHTYQGRILKSSRHQGKIYVNGLYVCTNKEYNYGYDFKPQFLKIDRDRKLVSDFDLQWLMSQMWSSTTNKEVINMAKQGSKDINYLSSFSSCNFKDDSDEAYKEFKEQYGSEAVPVTSQDELEKYRYTSKPILVNSTYKNIIKSSQYYEEPVAKIAESPRLSLERWGVSVQHKLNCDDMKRFFDLIKNLEF